MLGLDLRTLPFIIVAMLVAVTVHEFAHAWTAYRLGDPTARNRGRLTLNPISHLDPWGTLLLVLVGFGWAKPVPVEPSYFANPRTGMLAVALAGPLSNFAVAFLLGVPLKMGMDFTGPGGVLGVLLIVTIRLNIALGLFNLIPIPPLDGSRVVEMVLPPQYARDYARLQPWATLVLLVVLFTGAFSEPLHTAVNYVFAQATGLRTVF